MESLALILIVLTISGLPFLFYNKKIVFELNKRYYNMKDLNKAAVDHLRSKGKKCEVIDTTTLLVDGKKNGRTPSMLQGVGLGYFEDIICGVNRD